MLDIQTIQRLALAAVVKEPWDYTYRKICRWYSTTYATPLHYVEMDMEPEYVLQHYFEATFAKMFGDASEIEASVPVKEAWDKILATLKAGYAKAAEEQEQESNDDDNWEEEMKAMIAEEEAAKAKKKQKEPEVIAGPGLQDLADELPNLMGMDGPFEDKPPEY